MRRALLAPALLLALGTPVHSVKMEQIKSKKSDLQEIEREISQKKSEKVAAARKQKELAAEVDRISRELAQSRRALEDVELRVREAERKRKSTEERLWASRLEIGQWNEVLSRELRGFYERRAVMQAAAEVELAYRRAMLRDKADGVSFARKHHEQVEGIRDELLELEVELQKLRLNKEREEKRVQAARGQMRQLYETAQGRQAILAKEIRDLQSSAQQLGRLIQDLVRRRAEEEKARAAAAAKAGGTAAPAPKAKQVVSNRQRGRLPWPVEGRVVERFGRARHPELDTFVFSNGIRLQPAASAPVRAVEKGEVLYTGEFMSYGLMVLVQHPGNLHSVYANLGQMHVTRGQKVSVGEAVGAPGQDDAGRPAVYFELRVGGVAVDPLVWLQ